MPRGIPNKRGPGRPRKKFYRRGKAVDIVPMGVDAVAHTAFLADLSLASLQRLAAKQKNAIVVYYE